MYEGIQIQFLPYLCAVAIELLVYIWKVLIPVIIATFIVKYSRVCQQNFDDFWRFVCMGEKRFIFRRRHSQMHYSALVVLYNVLFSECNFHYCNTNSATNSTLTTHTNTIRICNPNSCLTFAWQIASSVALATQLGQVVRTRAKTPRRLVCRPHTGHMTSFFAFLLVFLIAQNSCSVLFSFSAIIIQHWSPFGVSRFMNWIQKFNCQINSKCLRYILSRFRLISYKYKSITCFVWIGFDFVQIGTSRRFVGACNNGNNKLWMEL